MRIVFDTSVLLAAFGTRGLCEALFAACLHGHQVILSEFILKEVDKHLSSKFKLSKQRSQEIIAYLRQSVELVEPLKVPAGTCRDKNDLPILGTGLAAKAEVIVSGDKDLLSIQRFQNILILSPRQLYDQISKE